MEQALQKKTILGVGVTDASEQDVLQYITKSLQVRDESYYIVTPNPEMIVQARKDKRFKELLNQARIALPDGVGIVIAAKIMGRQLRERITGTDLLDAICRDVCEKPITVGFLGGRDGVALKAAECLLRKYPKLKIGFTGSEWEDSGGLSAKWPANNRIDILFVAYGFPKQEEWMASHVGKIPVKVMMGVGGAFDYISGGVPRAPKFLRMFGFEWLYRLIVQPWRLRRQFALVKYIFLVMTVFFKRSREG